ncbi:hypothetical protein MUS_2657 [Bacillus velezensis YAU B9601-Y2]|uniref:Uncharacterized protein n=1 Tax=Bacillus amyloliquefaciens (strain Y2) TaxID=1155777 RepID=I2C7E7_BACAY|nr:hypothetical protein MUS_2657 [Bacillus velezensis YAU B9601-Y2]
MKRHSFRKRRHRPEPNNLFEPDTRFPAGQVFSGKCNGGPGHF